ncbi:unnamed protein product [Diamesa hyperborea]
MEKWQAKVAVVTGGNAGNGFAILRKLAESGLIVVAFDLITDAVDTLAVELKDCKIYAHLCDVTSDNSVETAFKWVEENLGGCDILVNNAGISKNIGVLEYEKSMIELSQVIEVNFTGVVRCTRQAFKSMKTRNDYGYIININSILGHNIMKVHGFKMSVYAGTKHAITALTKTIRQELKEMQSAKIRITSLSPGIVRTNILKSAGFTKEVEEAVFDAEPSLEPDDIADTVIYLLSTPYSVNVTELTVRPTGSTK